MAVTVKAIQTFPHAGRTVTKGDIIDLDSPLDAVLMHRKGQISLSKVYRTKVETPEPPPDPSPPPPSIIPTPSEPEPVPEMSRRRRRRYRRRDMTAETA